MKRRKEIDDLEYLAESAYAEQGFDPADISALRQKMQARVSQTDSAAGFALICLLCGAMLASSVYFPLFALEADPAPTEVRTISLLDRQENTAQEQRLDTVLVHAELFEKPEPANPANASARGVTAADTAEVFAEPLHLEPAAVPGTEPAEPKVRTIINTPVRYIHDLKVSNYAMLYFHKMLDGGLPGTPADQPEKEAEPVGLKDHADMWLHERLAEGLLLYKKRRYSESLFVLRDVAAYNSDDVNCDFYSAMCLYHLRDFEGAMEHYDACILSRNNAFSEESNYYKALCLLSLERFGEAVIMLNKIAAAEGFYAARAAQKLRDMQAGED